MCSAPFKVLQLPNGAACLVPTLGFKEALLLPGRKEVDRFLDRRQSFLLVFKPYVEDVARKQPSRTGCETSKLDAQSRFADALAAVYSASATITKKHQHLLHGWRSKEIFHLWW
eukprot:Skav224379  [mRNA]  locus=scaffold1155:76687:78568:- [translate_table: standard]